MTIIESIKTLLADEDASANAINLARRMTRNNEPDLLRTFIDDENLRYPSLTVFDLGLLLHIFVASCMICDPLD